MVKHPLFKASWEREELCLDDPGGELIYEHGTLKFVLFHESMMLSWNTRGKRRISSDEMLQMQNPPIVVLFACGAIEGILRHTKKQRLESRSMNEDAAGTFSGVCVQWTQKGFPVWISFRKSSTQVDMDF